MHQHGGVAPSSRIMLACRRRASRTALRCSPYSVSVSPLTRTPECRGGDRGARVLRRINVAGDQPDVAPRGQFSIKPRSGSSCAANRMRAPSAPASAVFLARRHSRASRSRQRDLLAAKLGERDVLDDVVGEGGLLGGGGGHAVDPLKSILRKRSCFPNTQEITEKVSRRASTFASRSSPREAALIVGRAAEMAIR